MRLLIYTCVFADYDRIFPPVKIDPEIDYIAITDDPNLNVRGWRIKVVDIRGFGSARAANRYYKMLGHRVLTGYDAAMYVDGNIRLIGPISRLLVEFLQTNAALRVYRHPKRGSVAEEVAACIEVGKVSEPARLRAELDAYLSAGFPDLQGLVEAGVLLKNNNHPDLDGAMELWWTLFQKYDSRDQISLPYVLWKTDLPCDWLHRSYRTPNPYFGVYPHIAAKGVPRLYTYIAARSYDSIWHRLMLTIWHGKWSLQRGLRKQRNVDR
jgi:hypothetical protein